MKPSTEPQSATDGHWNRPILVTGLPRSGTSLVAGLLGECGAWLGRTVPGGPPNPRGFFEHIALREGIDKGILGALGCDPLGVRRLPELDELLPVDNLRETALTLIYREGYDGTLPWLFKDAKLTLLWPLWARAFPQARWIIVRRDPAEVIASCQRTSFMAWHGLSESQWWEWVRAYEARLSRLQKEVAWCREIHPHALIRGGLAPLETLVQALGLRPDRDRMRAFILPQSWHGGGANCEPVQKNPKTVR